MAQPQAGPTSLQGQLASCKRLRTDPAAAGQEPERDLYALVHTHARTRTFDIALTDGTHAWSGQGLRPSKPPGFTEKEAWQRARQLLTEEDATIRQPAALAVTEAPDGELQLSWRWDREVGAGRHVMKLPPLLQGQALPLHGQPAAAALAKQEQPQRAIAHMLDVLVASYSKMQAAVRASAGAQASLAASLEAMRAQMDTQAAAQKARERELYLKFTMLLNQKTRQLQKEHELAQQLAAELERMKGEAEADTDDEHQQAAYAADEVAADAGAAAAAAGGGGTGAAAIDDGVETDPDPDSDGAAADGQPAAGAQAAAAAAAGAGGGGVDIDMAETQLLPEDELAAYEQQHQPWPATGGGGASGGGASGGQHRSLSQHLFPL